MNTETGASYPVSTGAEGEYYFPQVPTKVRSLYMIQVQWNGRAIYERNVEHPGAQEPIVIRVP